MRVLGWVGLSGAFGCRFCNLMDGSLGFFFTCNYFRLVVRDIRVSVWNFPITCVPHVRAIVIVN